jgi:hypothetical protein
MTFETYHELTEILQATFFPVFIYYLFLYTSLECLKKNSRILQPPRGKRLVPNITSDLNRQQQRGIQLS